MKHVYSAALLALEVSALALGARAATAQAPAATTMSATSVLSSQSTVGSLLDHPQARAVLARHLPEVVASPQIAAARALPLRALKPYVPALTDALLATLDRELALFAGPAGVAVPPALVREPEDALRPRTLPLWERGAPGALGEREQDRPSLTVFTPIPEQANGAAVIVAPGGGFKALASNHEGRQIADWFTARGVTAFVLSYRLTPFGYRHPTQKLDGERAVRWVRAHAAEFGVDPKRVGMMGFSAGGAVTAMVGTQGRPGDAAAADAIDRLSSRPDFLVLWYPGLLPMERRAELLGERPDPVTRDQVLSVNYVSQATPPTFIFHTRDDELVPPRGVLEFHGALLAAGVPVELHVFEQGRHGMGFALSDPALRLAPQLLEAWLQRRGALQP